MEENNNSKVSFWLMVMLIVLVLGFMGYIVYDRLLKVGKFVPSYNNTSTTTTNSVTTNQLEDNVESRDFEIKDILLDFEKKQINNVMNVGYDLLEPLTENRYKVNLTINNIEVMGKSHYIKVENYEPYDYDCVAGVDKVVSFDDNIIYEPYGEGCYLSGVSKIILFKKQYVIVVMGSQNGGWINIFDENGNEIKVEKDIVVSTIGDITDNYITFTGWDNENKDEVCKDNIYELQINNSKVSYKLVTKGENEVCI